MVYAEKWNYLNNLTDRYDIVYDYFLKEEWIDLQTQAIVADLCAGDWWIAKYCDRYYGCDVEPRDEENEWGHRRVQTATDKAFTRYIKPKFQSEQLWERVLCSFWYWGRAWLEKLPEWSLKKSEKDIESKTLDDSIFELLEVVDWFVLEWASVYVDGFIEKYRFDDEEAVLYKHTPSNESWVLDRKLYIFKM